MRKTHRRRTVLAVTSALLTLIVAAMWVDSNRVRQQTEIGGDERFDTFDCSWEFPAAHGGWSKSASLASGFVVRVRSCSGLLAIRCDEPIAPGVRIRAGSHAFLGFAWRQWVFISDLMTQAGAGGIGYHHYHVRELTVPFWFLTAVLAAGPMYVMARAILRRHQGRRTGLCRGCGYNLTGNLSGICPECGRPVSPEAWEIPSESERS